MQKKQLHIYPEEAQGKIGISYLKRIWSCIELEKKGLLDTKNKTNPAYVSAVFSALGIGIEPTYQYLFRESPSFDAFEDWILANGNISMELVEMFNRALLKDTKHHELSTSKDRILDEEALKQWGKEGYVIVRNAISKNDCDATLKVICDFLNIDLNDNSTWYKPHTSKQGIMVQLFRHEQLQKNRLSEKIQGAYKQLWNRIDLMVNTDRVSFNPPENESYKFPGPDLHWDVSLKTPIPFGLQGLLYLTDTPENQGAFTLVPGFHQKIETWLGSLENHVNPRNENLHALGSKPIAASAGDFIIWHHALPHGSSPNSGTQPRIVQYINYQPLNIEIQDIWI